MSIIMQKLTKYHTLLQSQPESEQQQLNQLKDSYLAMFTKQLENSAHRHWLRYRKNRKILDNQLATVQYYLKLANKNTQLRETGEQPTMNQDDQAQKEEVAKQWRQAIENVNLYALFKDIDDSIAVNQGMLGDWSFTCKLPNTKDSNHEDMLQKLQIQQSQQHQYQQLISHLLTKLSKQCQPLHQQYLSIQQKYTKLLKHQTTCLQATDIKIKDSLPYILAKLATQKYVRNVDISIVMENGIMSEEDYKNLGIALLKNRFYTRTLYIKIMDMEFCQEKCDQIKRYVKKFKVLEKFVLQNYYAECKMGNFVDFNWHPYRKNINIKAAVWK